MVSIPTSREPPAPTRSPLFGQFRLRVDPWEVDYGDQSPLHGTPDDTEETVDHHVEVPDADWRPITPAAEALPRQRVVFIDGVRRLEIRGSVIHGQRLIYCGFGSYAAGAVVVEGGAASFGPLRCEHLAVLGSDERLQAPIQVRENLVYRCESTQSEDPDGPLQVIQTSMRKAEARLALELRRDDTLVIVDGRLGFEDEGSEISLGYIKRIHTLYLPGKFLPLLATLPRASRTPLFLIKTAKAGFDRLSWFQRLDSPGPGIAELHGIVRLEVTAKVGTLAAAKLADSATAWLPQTAPTRGRDPRSPQNLLPIGALEQKLKACMGDVQLYRRWIETLVAQEALHG